MKLLKPEYSPVIGKTYSLFGNSDLTLEYFETIRMLADRILEREPDINYLVDNLNKFSSHKRALRKILENKVNRLRQVLHKASNPSGVKIERVDIARQMPEHPKII